MMFAHVRKHRVGIAALVCAAAALTTPQSRAATIGKDQVVLITTSPAVPSHCFFKNDAGAWSTYTTPEHLSVQKALGTTVVECESENGHYRGKLEIKPGPSPESLVDAPVGALYGASEALNGFSRSTQTMGGYFSRYDNTIVVPMKKVWDEVTSPAVASPEETMMAAPVVPTPASALQPAVTTEPAKPVHHVRHRARRKPAPPAPDCKTVVAQAQPVAASTAN